MSRNLEKVRKTINVLGNIAQKIKIMSSPEDGISSLARRNLERAMQTSMHSSSFEDNESSQHLTHSASQMETS